MQFIIRDEKEKTTVFFPVLSKPDHSFKIVISVTRFATVTKFGLLKYNMHFCYN